MYYFFLIMQNKTKWPYWLVVRVTRPEPSIQVDPELLPFGAPDFVCSISSFLHSALLFIVCPLVLFSFRHCIVCQTMTFFLLDIALYVKLWLFSFRHFIVCQTMTFFLLDIVLSVKLWLFFLLDIVLSVKLWLFSF